MSKDSTKTIHSMFFPKSNIPKVLQDIIDKKPLVPTYELPDAKSIPDLVNTPNLMNPLVEIAESNLASEFYQRLVESINEFDESLDNKHEIGVHLVNFGQSITFHLESIDYWNPSLILFKGHKEDDAPVKLIQHVNQISILLVKLPRKEPEKPKKKIGFRNDAEKQGYENT